jgi:hypothetical protein
MSQDQDIEQNINVEIGNKSFKSLEQFKYLRTTLTTQNFIHEEIKSKLMLGNAAVIQRRILSSGVLFKNVKINPLKVKHICFI